MKRREFISLLGGAAAAWPVVARGQQSERMRRIGVLMPGAAADSEYQARNAAFLQGLAELGWIVGRNVRLEYRWGGGEVDRYRALAAELLALSPDVVLAMGGPAVGALQRVSRTVPIVFANVTDPVGGGFVASLARPESNATGDFPRPNMASAESGWNCSRNSRLMLRMWPLCATPLYQPRSACWAASNPRLRLSVWKFAQLSSGIPPRWSETLAHSQASQMAA